MRKVYEIYFTQISTNVLRVRITAHSTASILKAVSNVPAFLDTGLMKKQPPVMVWHLDNYYQEAISDNGL